MVLLLITPLLKFLVMLVLFYFSLMRLSIVLLLTLLRSLCDFVGFFLIWEFLILLPPIFIVITKVLFRLHINDVFHNLPKHIEIDCHFIQQHVTSGNVRLLFITSVDQTANLFTKAYSPGRLSDLLSKIDVYIFYTYLFLYYLGFVYT
ncbi:hypothetical protein CsSME_00053857 [Camellia sinensis var. sinensis]